MLGPLPSATEAPSIWYADVAAPHVNPWGKRAARASRSVRAAAVIASGPFFTTVLAPALALAASLSWGVADFLAGLRSRRLPLLTVLLVVQSAGVLSIGLVVAARGQGPPGREPVLYAVLAGLACAVGLAGLYRGLAIGSMSVVAPITATGVVVPVGVGLATGDELSAAQAAGVVLAIAGVVLASREPALSGRARIAAGAGVAAVAAVAFGLVLVGLDAAADADALWATFVMRATSWSIWLAGFALLRPSLAMSAADLRALVLVGVLDTSANALFGIASTRELLSVVSVLAQLYPIATVLLARILLGERISRPQQAGVLAAFAGVALITTG
jgi:drug/metabolite transporter (DMT)-like permease